jgi:hypothetical protein
MRQLYANGSPVLGANRVPSVNGPDQVIGASKMRASKNRSEQWPYPWSYPPPNAKNAQPFGSIPAPQNGVQAQVLAYTVPTGMRFYLIGIIQQFAGTGFVQGSGSALWTLDKDTPISSGTQPIQSSSVAFFQSQPFTLGSFDHGAFTLGMPEIFEATTVIRSKVTTTASITPGAPNLFTTILIGYTVPAE